MNIESITWFIRQVGGWLTLLTVALLVYGLWRGTRRQVGRVTGNQGKFLQSSWFYLLSVVVYFGFCYLIWIPLPVTVSPQVRFWLLMIGSIIFFPGLGLALWARLALGKNYFTSTGLHAQLFADHQLITSGPFAFVRHPMYLGAILASIGSLLMYTTWTTLFFACTFAPILIRRARREEAGLASEFGEEWVEYCRRVPAFFPRLMA